MNKVARIVIVLVILSAVLSAAACKLRYDHKVQQDYKLLYGKTEYWLNQAKVAKTRERQMYCLDKFEWGMSEMVKPDGWPTYQAKWDSADKAFNAAVDWLAYLGGQNMKDDGVKEMALTVSCESGGKSISKNKKTIPIDDWITPKPKTAIKDIHFSAWHWMMHHN